MDFHISLNQTFSIVINVFDYFVCSFVLFYELLNELNYFHYNYLAKCACRTAVALTHTPSMTCMYYVCVTGIGTPIGSPSWAIAFESAIRFCNFLAQTFHVNEVVIQL